MHPSLRIGCNLAAITVAAALMASGAAALVAKPVLPQIGAVSPDIGRDGNMGERKRISLYDAILNRNLFKAARPVAKDTPSVKGNLQEAQVKASLLGTMHSDIAGLSRAVILEGNEQRMIKVGEPLEGYTVAAIERREVILAKGGLQHVLRIDRDEKASTPPPPPPEDKKSDRTKDIEAGAEKYQPPEDGARFVRRRMNGKHGLWLSELQTDSPFSMAGLKVGDMVLTVDGQPVPPMTGPGVKNMMTRPGTRLGILREGVPVEVVVGN